MKTFSVVLVGQPNVGKSSLINALSGAKMKVGNFSGVTIQKAEASLEHKGYRINVIDLPGTFALNGYTMEEKICRDCLLQGDYDLVLNVVDATNLERNLILSLQLKALKDKINKPLFLALNMIDEAEADGLEIDCEALSKELGLGLCPVSSTKKQNLEKLLDSLISLYEGVEKPKTSSPKAKVSTWSVTPPTPKDALGGLAISSTLALQARDLASSVQILPELRARLTAKLDSVLLHRIWSIPIFFLALFLVFQLSFEVGKFFQDLIQIEIVDRLAAWSKEQIPNELLASLVGDGMINGAGTVVSFLPLIATLFLGLTLLEGSGYMARVAFIIDGLFFRFGLHGKSFIPLVLGFGCSVPAYMATRTLQNQRDKLLTLFIIGFMSCSARLPIYLLFVAAFFEPKYAGLIMFGIYLGGVVIALNLALLLKKLVFKGESEPFVMDLPRYRIPTARVIWFSVWTKSFLFLKKAGTVILAGALLVWALATFPHSHEIDQAYEEKVATLQAETANLESDQKEDLQSKIDDLEKQRLEQQLEYSLAGRLGRLLHPIFSPLGFDWHLSVALITGFAAKEMVVTTLGVLYALGDSVIDSDEDNQALQEALRANIALPGAVAFILFIMLYIPCFAATAAFVYESGKKIYAIYLLLFTTAVAYLFAFLGHEITAKLMEVL